MRIAFQRVAPSARAFVEDCGTAFKTSRATEELNGMTMMARNERRQHADTKRRTAEQRHASASRASYLQLPACRHQHEDAPEPVDDGRIAASSSVRKTSGRFSDAGASSEMKMAMPSAMGVEIRRAPRNTACPR